MKEPWLLPLIPPLAVLCGVGIAFNSGSLFGIEPTLDAYVREITVPTMVSGIVLFGLFVWAQVGAR
jgi:hypothetical protein